MLYYKGNGEGNYKFRAHIETVHKFPFTFDLAYVTKKILRITVDVSCQ